MNFYFWLGSAQVYTAAAFVTVDYKAGLVFMAIVSVSLALVRAVGTWR